MGAIIPVCAVEQEVRASLLNAGLQLAYQGKVRDTFALPKHPDLLLVVATDRLSIFDFVLPCTVPGKGRALTQLTTFWLTKVLGDYDHHLVAWGADIDKYLPCKCRRNKVLQNRALVVKRLKILPVECVVRGYLTGSGWAAYKKTGRICDCRLPQGLYDGSQITPIFTPTSKEESGHDEPMSRRMVKKRYGAKVEKLSLLVYRAIADYAYERGIILADTKFEFGREKGKLILADEVGTPDSSRFWDYYDLMKCSKEQKSPPGYDKQPVREWGKTIETPFKDKKSKKITGINNLDPKNPDHIVFVHNLEIPDEVIQQTSKRYELIANRLVK